MIRFLAVEELDQYAGRLIEGAAQLPGTAVPTPERFLEKCRGLYTFGLGGVFGRFVGEELAGSLCAIVSNDFYTDEHTALELFWNVRPEYRHLPGWRGLFTAYETWARSRGATAIYLTHWSGQDRVGALLTTLGFKLSELHYRKDG